MNHGAKRRVGSTLLYAALLAMGCGDGGGNGGGAGGRADGSGGSGSSITAGTGGENNTGGAGNTQTGGAANSGGGGATGGTPNTGGNPGAGGTANTGGAPNTGGIGTSSGEPADLVGIVEAHNAERRMNNLPDLVWDPALAQVAQTWAAKCTDVKAPTGLIDHNTGLPSNVGYPGGTVGENIYGATANATGVGAVASWIAEKADYNYATNTCAPNKVCGHYTQVVWRNTKKVGCVLYDCTSLKFRKTVVCDYSPAGNFNGQKPY